MGRKATSVPTSVWPITIRMEPSSVMSTTSSTTLSSVPVMLAMVDRRGALSLFKNAMKNVLYRKNGASTNT